MDTPPSSDVRMRSGVVRFSVAMAAVIAYFFGELLLWDVTSWDPHHGIGRWAWQVLPWVVGLPFLRRVGMAPSQWLVASLIPFGSFWLVGRLVDRSLALPARDWPPAWWEVDRMVRLPRHGLWTLAPEPARPAASRLAPPAGSGLKRRLYWWSRLLWPVSFAALAIMILVGEAVTAWFAVPTMLSLVVVLIAPELAYRAARKPTETDAPALAQAAAPA